MTAENDALVTLEIVISEGDIVGSEQNGNAICEAINEF